MKRLFQISIDTLMVSLMPIFLWIILGFILNKEISYIFTLTYPFQFLYIIFLNLFAIGPNITAQKRANNDIVNSNMLLGVIIVGFFTFLILMYIDKYILLMNLNVEDYHLFTCYSILLFYFNFIIQLISIKLYYQNRNTDSNKLNFLFNFSNFIFIVILSICIQNRFLAVLITLLMDFILVLFSFFQNYSFGTFKFYIKDNIRYTSFELLKNLGMLITYGVGFKVAFSYGQKYIAAINLEGITTDAQWDMLSSVDTAAKIDLSKNEFNYRKSLKDAYLLVFILILSSVVMNAFLYGYYKPNLYILIIILSVQFIDMLLTPLKDLKMAYLQVNMSNLKNNFYYLLSRFFRLLCSFIPSAFCTYIGQLVSMIYIYFYATFSCKEVDLFKK